MTPYSVVKLGRHRWLDAEQTCHLFVVKPIPQPILTNYQKHTREMFQYKYNFSTEKLYLQMSIILFTSQFVQVSLSQAAINHHNNFWNVPIISRNACCCNLREFPRIKYSRKQLDCMDLFSFFLDISGLGLGSFQKHSRAFKNLIGIS